MYELRDKAYQVYIEEKAPYRPDYVLAEIRAAFQAGWAAHKKAAYSAMMNRNEVID